MTKMGKPQQHNIKDLNYFHKNPRIGDVQTIADSIRINGVYKPVVVNKGTHTGRPLEILAGNHTVKAHQQLINEGDSSYATIDCWVVDVTEEQANRIVLTDNRTADLGGYDNDNLLELLGNLNDGIDGTGYDDSYIDALLGMNTPDDFNIEDEYTTQLDELKPKHCQHCGYDVNNNPDELKPWEEK